MTRSRAEQALAQADPGRKRGAWVHLWCGLALWRVGDRTRGKQHLQRVAQHPQWSATPGLCISAFLMGEAPDSNLATASYRGAIEAFEGPGVPESEQDSWITRTLRALAARSESRGPSETTES